jgi:hypothetical protein
LKPMRFPFVCLAARHSSRGDGPGASTPGHVKLLLPPRQSRGNSHFGLVRAGSLNCSITSDAANALKRQRVSNDAVPSSTEPES